MPPLVNERQDFGPSERRERGTALRHSEIPAQYVARPTSEGTVVTDKVSADSRTKLKPLACPDCGHGFNRTYHKRSKSDADTIDVTFRTYKCDQCGRIYGTQEHRIESSIASALIVSEAGAEPFSRTQFENDLDRYIPKGLTAAERREVASDVERRVSEHLQSERLGHPASADLEPLPVRKLVEASALQGFTNAARRSWHGHSDGQDRVRVAHAMYALATLGRTWTDATAFTACLRTTTHICGQLTSPGRRTGTPAPSSGPSRSSHSQQPFTV